MDVSSYNPTNMQQYSSSMQKYAVESNRQRLYPESRYLTSEKKTNLSDEKDILRRKIEKISTSNLDEEKGITPYKKFKMICITLAIIIICIAIITIIVLFLPILEALLFLMILFIAAMAVFRILTLVAMSTATDEVTANIENAQFETPNQVKKLSDICEEMGFEAPVAYSLDKQSPIFTTVVQQMMAPRSTNLMLLGEAGCGKTIFVEALAWTMKHEKHLLPKELQHAVIFKLPIENLATNTHLRGLYEKKCNDLKIAIAEYEKEHKKAVYLFMDEFHCVMDSGQSVLHADKTSGFIDIFKPELESGKVKIIGATTDHEWKRHVKGKDPAMERRFECVHIPKTTPEQMVNILSKLQSSIPSMYNFIFTENAIERLILLCTKLPAYADLAFPAKGTKVFQQMQMHLHYKKSSGEIKESHVDEFMSERHGLDIDIIRGLKSDSQPLPSETTDDSEALDNLLTALARRLIAQ